MKKALKKVEKKKKAAEKKETVEWKLRAEEVSFSACMMNMGS